MIDPIDRQDAIKAIDYVGIAVTVRRGISLTKYRSLVQEVCENVLSAQKKKLCQVPSAQLIPCDVCRYYPPSSTDGKPCSVCPAEGGINE
jgi:hypothetical protein